MLASFQPRSLGRIVLFSLVYLPLLGGIGDAAVAVTHSGHAPAARHTSAPQRAPLTKREQTLQILDRFTFGPTPGMVQAVSAEGWQRWFAQQLDPASIPDPVLDAQLAKYPSLRMTPAQLAVQFPDGQVIRRIAAGKEAMPTDPRLAGAYAVMLARYQQREAMDKADAASPAEGDAAVSDPASDLKAARKAQEQQRAGQLAGSILALPPGRRLDAVLALPVPDRMALTRGLSGPMRNDMLQGVSPRDRRAVGDDGRRLWRQRGARQGDAGG